MYYVCMHLSITSYKYTGTRACRPPANRFSYEFVHACMSQWYYFTCSVYQNIGPMPRYMIHFLPDLDTHLNARWASVVKLSTSCLTLTRAGSLFYSCSIICVLKVSSAHLRLSSGWEVNPTHPKIPGLPFRPSCPHLGCVGRYRQG